MEPPVHEKSPTIEILILFPHPLPNIARLVPEKNGRCFQHWFQIRATPSCADPSRRRRGPFERSGMKRESLWGGQLIRQCSEAQPVSEAPRLR